jgi:hypothetical protein
MMSYPVVLDMVRGRTPTIAELLKELGSPQAFWEPNPVRSFAMLRLNQAGRGADLLTFYDAVFPSPEGMAERTTPLRLLAVAGPITVALRDANRGAEAERLMTLADQVVARAFARGRVPFEIIELAAQIRALQGRNEEALSLLERAFGMGWQYDRQAMLPRLADDPVYRSIRDSPRLIRLDKLLQGSIARERREARALQEKLQP